jgi:hypothetical protein
MTDVAKGTLEVGTNGHGEVVINHPDLMPDENGVGHIVFSVEQALNLAHLLHQKANQAAEELRLDKMRKAAEAPVDRSARVLVSGDAVPEDQSHTALKENGQQQDYVVLTAAERAKGFARPYRDAYRHLKCGKITTMSRAIAETYARDPYFYAGTFCTTCRAHFPVGENGEFVWYEMDGSTGPKVGS